jgi:hypothetical protein
VSLAERHITGGLPNRKTANGLPPRNNVILHAFERKLRTRLHQDLEFASHGWNGAATSPSDRPGVMAIFAYALMVALALLTTFAFLNRKDAADDNN